MCVKKIYFFSRNFCAMRSHPLDNVPLDLPNSDIYRFIVLVNTPTESLTCAPPDPQPPPLPPPQSPPPPYAAPASPWRDPAATDCCAIPTRPRPYPPRVERVLRPAGPPSRAASGRPPPQAPRTTTAILPWPHSPADQPPHPQAEEGDFIPVPRAPWQPVIRQSRYFPRWG